MYLADISDYLFDSFLLRNYTLMGVKFVRRDQSKNRLYRLP